MRRHTSAIGILCGFAILACGPSRSEAAEADAFGLETSTATAATAETDAPVREVQLAPVRVDAPIPLTIFYSVEFPLKVNGRAPKTIRVGSRKLKAKPGGAPYQTTLGAADIQNGSIRVTADYYVCEDRPDALCWARKVIFEIPVVSRGKKVDKLDLTTPQFSTN